MKAEVGKIYRHYGGNFYKVLGITKHTETEEEMVAYRALNLPSDAQETIIWSRPKEMFEGKVDLSHFRGDEPGTWLFERFTKVETVQDWMKIVDEVNREKLYYAEQAGKFKEQVKFTCKRAEEAEERVQQLENKKRLPKSAPKVH